jgi:diguanylate cyclase (GGDEF)-like protein
VNIRPSPNFIAMQTHIMSRFVSLDSKTQRQLRTTAIVAADYFINVLILFGFAVAGTIPYDVAVRILLVAVAFNAIFLGGIACGLAQRFSDSASTGVQVLAACGINLLGLLYAPQIAYMFIVNLFAPLSYGSLYFNKRMFLHTWLLLSSALAAVMLMVGAHAAIAYGTIGERLLFWGVVTIALGRFLAVHSEISRARTQLQSKNDELTKASAALADLASRDALTGLWNRREFMRLLHDESRRAVRSRLSFCVAVIDIDNFKQINERYSHLTGDTVLHEFAQFLEARRRATDAVARYDGKKFALLLAGAKTSTATVALERIRHEAAQQDWESIVPGLQLTITAGAAAWQPGETLVAVLKRAEAALGDAKNAGRNCVRVSTPVQPVTS